MNSNYIASCCDQYNIRNLVDLDGDGDLDLVLGPNGGLKYWKNSGTATSPVFAAQDLTCLPRKSNGGSCLLPSAYNHGPELADMDGDGD